MFSRTLIIIYRKWCPLNHLVTDEVLFGIMVWESFAYGT